MITFIVAAIILWTIYTWIRDYSYEHSEEKLEQDGRLVDDILNDKDY